MRTPPTTSLPKDLPMSLRSRLLLPASLSLLTFSVACGSGGGGGSGDPAEVTITVTGSTLPMLRQTRRSFSAAVGGTSDDSVVWTLAEGATAGTIAGGRYVAGTTPGTYHIVATAHADAAKSDTATVTVHGFGTSNALGVAAYGVAVNGAGKIAIADNGTKVRFIAAPPGDSVTAGNNPVHVVYNAAGTIAWATIQSDNALVRLQVSPAQSLSSVGYGHSLYNLALHPSGTALYVTSSDGWLFKADPTTLAKQDSVLLASASNGLAFAPGAARLYVSTIAAGVVYAINPTTLAKIDSFVVGSGAQRVAVAPGGDSVYVANEGVGGVNVIRPSTRTVTTLTMAGTPYGLALSADSAALYVTLRTAGTVRILGRPALDSLATIAVGGTPRNVAAAPSGDFMVVSTESDVVKIQ